MFIVLHTAAGYNVPNYFHIQLFNLWVLHFLARVKFSHFNLIKKWSDIKPLSIQGEKKMQHDKKGKPQMSMRYRKVSFVILKIVPM